MTRTKTQYLTTEQLAKRYSKSVATIRRWRVIKYGPPYNLLSKKEALWGESRARYPLHDLLAWEEINNITPINSF